MTLVYHLYGHDFVTWSQEEAFVGVEDNTVYLRLGNVKFDAQLLRIHYQE
jgi:hypothetical protein